MGSGSEIDHIVAAVVRFIDPLKPQIVERLTECAEGVGCHGGRIFHVRIARSASHQLVRISQESIRETPVPGDRSSADVWVSPVSGEQVAHDPLSLVRLSGLPDVLNVQFHPGTEIATRCCVGCTIYVASSLGHDGIELNLISAFSDVTKAESLRYRTWRKARSIGLEKLHARPVSWFAV